MAIALSTLGIAHTGLSMVPVIAGAYAFYRFGRIDPAQPSGRWYQIGLLASVVTAFGLSSTGGITAGHILGLIALAAVAVGRSAMQFARLANAREYLQIGAMSFSYFVLLVPGINETLSRLPVGNPIGDGPESPEVKGAIFVALICFFLGVTFQMLRLRRQRAVPVRACYSTRG